MAQARMPTKYMTFGEGGTAIALIVLTFVSLLVAARAYAPEYAFHAYLFVFGSVAAVIAIVNRYFERPAATPLTIDGKPNYNMGPVKFATVAAVFWGIAGFTVGLWAALELAFPAFNLDLPWISFGRLRPLHTSAVIFAFGGNVLLASSFYVVQRTCRARLAGDIAPWFVVLGYNFFIVIAGTGYLLGITQSVVTVVANAYQQPRATCLDDSTNGVIVHATGDANIWETFEGTVNPNTSDFVGLIYPQAQVFGVIKVDLGWQFGDGGDWELQPLVYILKNPIDTNQRYPETDPADWVQVPAALMSGNVFNYGLDGPIGVPTNTPIAFDLSHLPLTQRTGFGWAVGGVPANQAAHFVSIAELRGFGVAATDFTNVTGAPQVMLDLPASIAQPAGLPLTLRVYATGTQPINYQWKRNGVDLADSSLISGSHSSVLTLAEAFANDAGTYQLAMTNSAGSALSTACAVSVTRIQPNNGAAWTQNFNNGNGTPLPVVSSDIVTLTDGLVNEATSLFLNYPQYIGAFVASFTYQDVGGGGADGVVFVLQNDPRGAAALGGGGGGLGYSGITPSVGLEFNIYAGNSPSAGNSGIAFRLNGATGVPYSDSSPVSPASGHPIGVTVRYDGTTVSLTMTDTVAHVAFSTNYVADLPTLLGTNTAYVGITGATGGVGSTQRISNFYFAPMPAMSFGQVSPGVFHLSWPASAGGLSLQSTADLVTGSWTTVPNPVTLVNDQNQVQISTVTGSQFYRLGLP